jgi:flagellar biosynthesis GTPase FlhF
MGLAQKKSVEVIASSPNALDQVPHIESAPIASNPDAGRITDIEKQVEEVKRSIGELSSSVTATKQKDHCPITDRLIRQGISQFNADMIVTESDGGIDQITNSIEKRINCSGAITRQNGQRRVALVGPTGVGKTTTAAKLAAQCILNHKMKVAFITLDTYRIGAVEQLSAYARILNVPIEVALSPEDGEGLIARHTDKDLIIIDTVGRSQRNREHISELGFFLRSVHATDVHLVISASANQMAQKEAVDSFSALCANRIILTKLDECPQPGCILELAASSLLPFSYVTYGQNVPDDIAVAKSSKLASYIWDGVL